MRDQRRAVDQDIRDVIVAAGRRVEPPAEEVAAIKEAARGEWQAMVERERRRGRARRLRGGLALAAGVLLAVAIGWWWANRAPLAGPVVAGVELATSAVRAGDSAALVVGAELTAGAVVETAGTAAGAALRLVGGQSLRLAADSRVRLASAGRLELERGALYVDSGRGAAGVEVVTDLGTVRDVGTQFEVRLDADGSSLRLRVREGECALETAGSKHTATRGEQLERAAASSVRRSAIAPYGAEWDWVVATAPKIRIDGRSLAAVLEEVERELGREIRYADAGVEEFAAGAIQRGPAEGVAPAAILETMGLANSLSYRVENGTILITRQNGMAGLVPDRRRPPTTRS